MDNQDLPMPFGRHSGTAICDLPTKYLAWCLENLQSAPKAIRNHIADEYNFRTAEKRSSQGAAERKVWKAFNQSGAKPGSRPSSPHVHRPDPPTSETEQCKTCSKLRAKLEEWRRKELLLNHPDRNGSTKEAQAVAQAINAAIDRLKNLISSA